MTITEIILTIFIFVTCLKLISAILKKSIANRQKEVPYSTTYEKTVNEKVAPFIEIHLNKLQQLEKDQPEDSIDRLKEKIENFKYRNRFYDNM